MKTKTLALAFCAVLATPTLALAGGACPDPVKAAVDKAYPGAKIASCKQEHEDGRDQIEVKLTRKDGGKMELDVALDGKILQTEEQVGLDTVPAAVMKAFAAKYPKAKATRAEKETHENGGVFFELGFQGEKGKPKEATFAADGKFVEEE